MKGYPKHLNTKADYEYIREHFPDEEWRGDWQALLDNHEAWLMVRKLGGAEVGQVDATHKIVENELADGKTERYQYEFMEDHNAALFKKGFTVAEVMAGLSASVQPISYPDV